MFKNVHVAFNKLYRNVCRMPSIIANVKLFVLYDIPPKIKYKKIINKPKVTNVTNVFIAFV